MLHQIYHETTVTGAVGAIDACHIEISKPGNQGDEYINRKGWPSLNMQVTVDANEKITSFDCSWPGKTTKCFLFVIHFCMHQFVQYSIP